MPRTANKTLSFPLAGVDRQGGYRKQTRPYAAPWAANVRSVGPLESRERGGSRPGLSRVCVTDLGEIVGLYALAYLDGAGVRQYDLVYIGDGAFGRIRGGVATATDGELQTSDGTAITTSDGTKIVFESAVSASSAVAATGAYAAAVRGGRLYLADSVLRVYDPVTGVVAAVIASAGTVPTSQPLVCVYQDRLVVGGDNHLWYASRQSDPTDWDFGAGMEDVGRAVAGQLAHAGGFGGAPTAIIPVRDQALVFATSSELWVLRGGLATGRLEQINSEIGVVAPNAWAMAPDGALAFLSHDGVYVWIAGSGAAPKRFSELRVPDELREVNTTTNVVTMVYDAVGRGFHLCITPTAGTLGSHWWLDLEHRAMWPVVFHAGHQPVAAARLETSGLATVVLGCADGYLRKFNPDATSDDGSTLESHVLIGPVRMTSDDMSNAIIAELHGIMADLTGVVTWRLVMGDSAEAAADRAVTGVKAALAGTAISGVSASGSWGAGRNMAVRPRARGPWAVVWIEGTGQWAYEAVAVVARQLGRIR